MKVGTVALVGRPNSGKSTLVNNLVGQKVAITSPKPQTTQFPIYAVYESEDTQIIFVDTPGIFARLPGGQAKAQNKKVNLEAERVLREEREPSYREEYRFMEDEFDSVVDISAIKAKNLPLLVKAILKYLKEGERTVAKEELAYPALNIDSKLYIEENIREKAFLVLRDELPYNVRITVDQVAERENGMFYIKARLITAADRYKKMIIGAGGKRIKIIGSMARRELELATSQKIFLDLTVEVEE